MFGFQVTHHFHIRSIHVDDLFVSSGLNKNPPLLIHVLSLHPPPLQKDNVSNQREHLILLLANVHIRQLSKPEQQPKVLAFAKYTCERCVHMNPCVMILFTHFLLVIFSVR
jgi:hypothetical protein